MKTSPLSRRARRLGPLAIALVAAVGSACSGSRAQREALAHRPPQPRTSAARFLSGPQSTPAARGDKLAVGAVRVYWATYLDLAGRSGSFDTASTETALTRVATGAAFDRLLVVLGTNAAAGYVVRGTIASHPRVISHLGRVVVVRDCYDDRSGLYQAADGTRIDADDPRLHLAIFRLEHEADGWKVAAVDRSEEPCANS